MVAAVPGVVVSACGGTTGQTPATFETSTTPPSGADVTTAASGVEVDLFARSEQIRTWGEAMVTCMAYVGFDIPFDGVVGFIVDETGPQVGEFDAVMTRCQEQVELVYPPPRRLSREEAYRVKLEVARCLREQGFDIPEAPSLESFLDSWERGPWDPYRFVSAPPERWVELNRICPPF